MGFLPHERVLTIVNLANEALEAYASVSPATH